MLDKLIKSTKLSTIAIFLITPILYLSSLLHGYSLYQVLLGISITYLISVYLLTFILIITENKLSVISNDIKLVIIYTLIHMNVLLIFHLFDVSHGVFIGFTLGYIPVIIFIVIIIKFVDIPKEASNDSK